MRLTLLLLCWPGLCFSQEAITAEQALADQDFYRIVACAAPVGGDCQKDLVRWSPADAREVSIGIVQVDPGYPANLLQLADDALSASIAAVNAAGANLHLTRSGPTGKPDISVYFLTIEDGDRIRGTGRNPLDGTFIQAARTQLWWRDDLSIIDGAVVFASDVPPADVASIMLEEITQSMGLLTDIEGAYYEMRSIFSETSNRLTSLGPQDLVALQMHYP